jgi:hypothetical protein
MPLDGQMSIGEAISLIAELGILTGTRGQARDKAGKRVKDAIQNKQLTINGDMVRLRDLLVWMSRCGRWHRPHDPSLYSKIPNVRAPTGFDSMALGHPHVYSVPLPQTIAECHQVIRNAYVKIIEYETNLTEGLARRQASIEK